MDEMFPGCTYKPMTERQKQRYIKEVELGVIKNQKLPNKGFDDEEILGMTKKELKEYGVEEYYKKLKKMGGSSSG